MSPLAIGITGLAALMVLIGLKIPIGIAMIVVGVAGFALQVGWQPALTLLVNDPSLGFVSTDLVTIPLFLLMGSFANAAGFSRDIFAAAAAMLGHRRGGLAYASISGCALFGAVCGSSPATAVTFVKVALPEMLSRGYAPGYAVGTIAAGGALKSLIPPSLVMILYCIVSRTFILDMFIAAIVPALLIVSLNLLAIFFVSRIYPHLTPVSDRVPWPERIRILTRATPAFALILVVFGGLYSGIFTVNEAASVAATLSLVFALIRGNLKWNVFAAELRATAGTAVMIYVIIFGATVFGYFVTIAHVPEALVQLVSRLALPSTIVVILIVFAYLVLGAIFDEIAAMLITIPFVLPIILGFGYDALWWGVINVVIIELGMMIPPIGIIVLIVHGMAPNIGLTKIYRGVTPFIIADTVLLTLLIVAPGIALWLPRLLHN